MQTTPSRDIVFVFPYHIIYQALCQQDFINKPRNLHAFKLNFTTFGRRKKGIDSG